MFNDIIAFDFHEPDVLSSISTVGGFITWAIIAMKMASYLQFGCFKRSLVREIKKHESDENSAEFRATLSDDLEVGRPSIGQTTPLPQILEESQESTK